MLEQFQWISDSALQEKECAVAVPNPGLSSPGGHEGGHVQLQWEGNISRDLPPQFGWMFKPLKWKWRNKSDETSQGQTAPSRGCVHATSEVSESTWLTPSVSRAKETPSMQVNGNVAVTDCWNSCLAATAWRRRAAERMWVRERRPVSEERWRRGGPALRWKQATMGSFFMVSCLVDSW